MRLSPTAYLERKYGKERFERLLALVQDPTANDSATAREFELSRERIRQIRAELGNPKIKERRLETADLLTTEAPFQLRTITERCRKFDLSAQALLESNGYVHRRKCIINGHTVAVHHRRTAQFVSPHARTKWCGTKLPKEKSDFLIMVIDLPESEVRTFVIPWQHLEGKTRIDFPESSMVYPNGAKISKTLGIPVRKMSGLGIKAESRTIPSQAYFLQFLEAWHLLQNNHTPPA